MRQGLTDAVYCLLCGSLLREREAVLTHNSLIPRLKVMVRRLPHACMAAVVNPYDDHGTRVRRPPYTIENAKKKPTSAAYGCRSRLYGFNGFPVQLAYFCRVERASAAS